MTRILFSLARKAHGVTYVMKKNYEIFWAIYIYMCVCVCDDDDVFFGLCSNRSILSLFVLIFNIVNFQPQREREVEAKYIRCKHAHGVA